MKFLHTMIRVKNIEKSIDFYQNILGLNVTRTIELSDCKLYFLQDESGESQIELTYNFKTPENGYDIGNGFGHFAFEVDNMDSFSKLIEQNGLEFLYKPFYLKPGGSKLAFIKDPDGYQIELIEKVNF